MKIEILVLTFCIFAATIAANEENCDGDDCKKSVEVDDEKLDYAKGSMCGYCEYCTFCQLCDADCPCEVGPTKPNCHMCKYCKYCYLCSAVCDTVCQAGGFLDTASSALVNALPYQDKDEIDGDINGVRQWIDAKKEEL